MRRLSDLGVGITSPWLRLRKYASDRPFACGSPKVVVDLISAGFYECCMEFSKAWSSVMVVKTMSTSGATKATTKAHILPIVGIVSH